MRIINYNYGYQFGCSIHGKIIVSSQEWVRILRYLRHGKVRQTFLPSYPWTITMLEEDIQRKVPVKGGYLVNIRVPMTSKAVAKFADLRTVKRYKTANYMFLVLNNQNHV